MAVEPQAGPAREAERPRHERLGLTREDLLGMHRAMLGMRMSSERMMQLNRMGRSPFVAGSDGHEAAEVGAGWCIERGVDWALPYYRDLGVMLALGMSMVDEFRAVFGKATEPSTAGRQILNQFCYPELRVFTNSICVGTQFPHAVGIALAGRLRGERYRTWVFGGDASTSPGDWHEAMNFASIHKLPVVFVIENNTLAISTTIEKQMAIPDVVVRAAAYGMRGFLADGMDVLDTYEKCRAAAEHVGVAGNGPVLVELKCYRYQPHTSDDDDSKYRSKETVASWRARDPLDRSRTYLLANGATADELDAMRAAVATEIEAAIEQAEGEPDPSPATALRHVYAEDRPLPSGTRA